MYCPRQAGSETKVDRPKINSKAGMKAWGRLFHNLRSSLETELVEIYPVHVVAHWLGNSIQMATQHYLQIRDADYERAATTPEPAAQIRAHHGGTQRHTEAQSEMEKISSSTSSPLWFFNLAPGLRASVAN